VLLEGEMGTGKTALACDIAKRSEFPFVKIISPETLVGFTVKFILSLGIRQSWGNLQSFRGCLQKSFVFDHP
jgi:SpoVK/Ycf46/Vps4 family AAA+-type ATPase